MPTFTLKRIDSIKGKQSFDKLVIDGNCPFEQFEEILLGDERESKKLGSIYFYMEQIAQLNPLPHTKFKDITPHGEVVKEYELKKMT